MKRKTFITLISVALFLVLSGCKTSDSNTEQNAVESIDEGINVTSKESSEEIVENPIGQPNKNTTSYDYGLLFSDTLIRLHDWDSEVDLDEVFGPPLSEEVEVIEGAGQLTGSFIKRKKYVGLQIELFSPSQNGKTYWIKEIKITNDLFSTATGIRVGMKLSDLKSVYPEIPIALDGRTDPNNCAYVITLPDTFNYVKYEVKDGIIQEIWIYHEIN